MNSVILISDNRVKRIPIQESNEPLVDILQEYPELKVDLDRKYVQNKSKSISLARKDVGRRLIKAQEHLPPGIKFLIKECHRPLAVQREFWQGYQQILSKDNPGWSELQLYEECSKYSAPPDVAPHATGGAVDLTLIDEKGEWLDMGTEFNASPHTTNGATYTSAENISAIAKKNRKILILAMAHGGFVNYPTEWWHWSYGEKYWAMATKNPVAIYGPKEVE